MVAISKNLIELFFVIGSLLALAVSATFAFATIRAQLAIAKIELAIKTDRLEFARKVQQNIDANLVDIGTLKCEIEDIKGALEKHSINFRERQGFPKENKPRHTDFT